MAHRSPARLLVLHAVRLKGFADVPALAGRFGLPAEDTAELLLDAQAHGWVAHSEFAGDAGWSLTEAGRARNEAMLAEELDVAGARPALDGILADFEPLNTRATTLFTACQLDTGMSIADVFRDLADVAGSLAPLNDRLTAHLDRFTGYHDRFTTALARAGGDRDWITGISVDSCHRVWFELHEDLIATLGRTR